MQIIVARQHDTTATKVTDKLITHFINLIRLEIQILNIYGRDAIVKPFVLSKPSLSYGGEIKKLGQLMIGENVILSDGRCFRYRKLQKKPTVRTACSLQQSLIMIWADISQT